MQWFDGCNHFPSVMSPGTRDQIFADFGLLTWNLSARRLGINKTGRFIIMLRRFLMTIALITMPITAQAEGDMGELNTLLKIPEIIQIMREEGLKSGGELFSEMQPGRDDTEWSKELDEIYNTETMIATFNAHFEDTMGSTDLAPLITFFGSERGRKIIQLELSGREALLDEAIGDLSKDALQTAVANDDPRLKLIERYSDVNGLVETNVEGALNSNFAFFRGMQDAGPKDRRISEEQMLFEVWSQEPQIRADTQEWVFSYLLMAYGPLSDEDLEAYIALSETEEGQAMNNALFIAFDVVFTDISYALGQGIGRFDLGEDI